MNQSFTPREFIDKINAENPGPAFDPYGVEGLIIKQQEDSAGPDLLARAKAEVAKEKAKDTPEGKVAELERQVEAMRQWLMRDGTYTPKDVDSKIRKLKVKFNQETQQAEVVGTLLLGGLDSAKHLTLPDSFGGDLDLDNLTSTEHLTLPTSIGGGLYLNSLTSAEHLKLPDSIGAGLGLNSLTSADGLKLPDSISGGLGLSGLTSAERDQIREQRPDLANKIYPIP